MAGKRQPSWEQCLDLIQANVNPEQFTNWFGHVSFVSFDTAEKELMLRVPTQLIMEYIEGNFKKILYAAIWRVYGDKEVRLKWQVEVDSTNHITTEVKGASRPIITRAKPKPAPENDLDSQLNSEYTFDNFIEGASNRLSRSVGISIAKNPKTSTFNPFFIWGHSGVGKTHLATAIGLMTKELHPRKRVLYVSSHTFQVQYTDAVRYNTTNDFIRFYQTIDVLIVDDVQEIVTKGTQQAFFHIFNHLKMNGKQIILTCDRDPSTLQGFEERLLTRFKWGLTSELEKPTEELCRDILINKVHRDGLQIPQDIINFIAKAEPESVRDLEGVINSLMAWSVVYNRDLDMAMAEPIIRRALNIKNKPITVDQILERTSEYFKVPIEDIYSQSRKAPYVLARQTAMYLAQELTTTTTSRIGLLVGKRNHATVLHAIKQCKDRLETDKAYRAKVEELTQILKQHK